MEAKKRRKLDEGNSGVLIGQLAARSHIINTCPPCEVLEIVSCDNSLEYIISDPLILTHFSETLIIGQNYKFMNLSSAIIHLEPENVKCYRTSNKTICQEARALDKIYCRPFSNFFNIKGRVSSTDYECGILYLNDSLPVIISSCSMAARVPNPKEGDNIEVFNVHRLGLDNGGFVYAMCIKSLLRIEGEETTAVAPIGLSPLLSSLGGSLRDYRLFMCLQDCSALLQKSFDDDFLSSHGIPLEGCGSFRSSVLQNIAKHIIKKSKVKQKSFLKEFMAVDHSLHCGAIAEDLTPFTLLSLHEFEKENPSLDAGLSTLEPDSFAKYDIKIVPQKVLVGVTSVKSSIHRLTLNDSFGSVPLLIMPQPCMRVRNKMVLIISNYFVIQELFPSLEGRPCSQKFKSLGLLAEYVDVVSSFSDDKLPSPRQTSPLANESAAQKISCISPLRGQPLQQYRSQYIFVRHKTALCVPKEGQAARCYLLVASLDKPSSNPSQRSTGDYFVCLEKFMLSVHPFIAVNNIYEIRVPLERDELDFKKGSPLSFSTGFFELNRLRCTTLPNNCEIHEVPDHNIPLYRWKFGYCYGVAQTLEIDTTLKPIHIVGYIVNRFHQEPRYPREMLSVKANGFGVPGRKVLAIVLRDSPPESLVGPAVTLYLSYWVSLQYPIGLWPGARVIFRCVTRSVSKTGVFLRSTILSSVEFLDLPKPPDEYQCLKDIWGARSLLDLAENTGCRWVSISTPGLHRLAMRATCSSCHQFQNASCSATHNLEIFSQACLKIYSFRSVPAFVLVPSALMSKLFHSSKKMWKLLINWTKICGHLDFRSEMNLDVSQLSIEHRILGLLCSKILMGQRFHLLCRQLKLKNSDVSVFYAVDIAHVSYRMATY